METVTTVNAVTGELTYVEQVIAPIIEPVTQQSIIDERDRRLASGFDYDFGDARGVHTFATTDSDMRGWDEVTTGAQAAINLGSGSSTFDIVTETGPVTVTGLEWQQILVAATAFRRP